MGSAVDTGDAKSSRHPSKGIFDVIGHAVLILSPDRRVLSANRAAVELLGLTRDEIIDRRCAELHHRNGTPPPECPFDAMRRDGAMRTAEMEIDSLGRRCLVSCTPVSNESGDLTHIIHVATDVTELRAVEETLRAREATHSLVLDSFIDPLHVIDADLRIRFINRAFHEWLGGLGVPAITTGKNLFEQLPFLEARARTEYEQVFATGEILTTQETTHVAGREVHTETRKIPVFEDGRALQVVTVIRDMTPIVVSRRALQDTELRFHSAFDRSPVAMSLLSTDGRIFESNRATELLLGRGREDLIERDIAEYVHPDDLGGFRESLSRLVRGAANLTRTTVRFVHRDGRSVWTSTTAQRVHATETSPPYLMLQWIDITAQRTAELALRSSEEMYRTLVQASPDAVTTVDLSGHITFASIKTAELCGYAVPQDMVGLPLRDRIAEKDQARAAADLQAIGHGGEMEAEYAVVRADGSLFDASTRIAPLRDGNGVLTGYIWTTRDITERKAIEEQLLLTKHSLDVVSSSVLWVSPDGRFLYANAAASKNLEYSLRELRGLNVSDIDLAYPETRRPVQWARVKSAGSLLFETAHRRKSGSIFPVEIRAQYVRYGDREMEFAIATDISARKESEAETALLRAQLIQQQKLEAIGTLASGVAHEINNPLTGVINYAQLIYDRIDDEQLADYACGIIGEGERMARIVRSLLSFSRQDPTEFYPAAPSEIVDEVLHLVGASLRRDRIMLRSEIDGELPRVVCHAQQIEQVLLNLITNARDALDLRYSDRADPDKRITLSAIRYSDDDGEWLRFTVEDTGAGISPEIVDRIFEPFFTTKSRSAGTGLGLSVSYGIMTEHQGRLSVDSVSGTGSRFHADLPLR